MAPVQAYDITAHADAPPEVVFAVLEDAPGWSGWTRIANTAYEREGDDDPHGVGAIRRFGTGPVTTREEVTAHDPPRHFAYRLLSGLPARGYRATVDLSPAGAIPEAGTDIHWRGQFEPGPPGTRRLMAASLGFAVRDIARRLVAEAERRAR
jgi:hypothetical protein